MQPSNDINWKCVEGYEGVYEVSAQGEVRRVGHARGAVRGHWLHKYEHQGGYIVQLWSEGKGRRIPLHMIVAKAFLPEQPDNTIVRFLDGDRTNCHADNLVWGPRPVPSRGGGEKASASKLSDAEAAEIYGMYHHSEYRPNGTRVYTQAKLARIFDVSRSAVASIVRGERKGDYLQLYKQMYEHREGGNDESNDYRHNTS